MQCQAATNCSQQLNNTHTNTQIKHSFRPHWTHHRGTTAKWSITTKNNLREFSTAMSLTHTHTAQHIRETDIDQSNKQINTNIYNIVGTQCDVDVLLSRTVQHLHFLPLTHFPYHFFYFSIISSTSSREQLRSRNGNSGNSTHCCTALDGFPVKPEQTNKAQNKIAKREKNEDYFFSQSSFGISIFFLFSILFNLNVKWYNNHNNNKIKQTDRVEAKNKMCHRRTQKWNGMRDADNRSRACENIGKNTGKNPMQMLHSARWNVHGDVERRTLIGLHGNCASACHYYCKRLPITHPAAQQCLFDCFSMRSPQFTHVTYSTFTYILYAVHTLE